MQPQQPIIKILIGTATQQLIIRGMLTHQIIHAFQVTKFPRKLS